MSHLRPWHIVLLTSITICPLPGHGGTQRVDDSLTYTDPPFVQMQWRELSASRRDTHHLEAWLKVHVRLDTRPWQGKNGRIYMRLDRDDDGQMEVTWRGQGRLMDGRLKLGDRALVYAGTISGPAMTDTLSMRLRSTPDWVRQSRRMNFSFEIDTDNAP